MHLTSGVIGLISGGTSIGTILHFKKKFKKMNKEKMKLDIENEEIDIDSKDMHKHIKKQVIHFEQMGIEMVDASSNVVETGRPNKVAESLADVAGSGVGMLGGPEDIQSILGSGIQSLVSSAKNSPALEYRSNALLLDSPHRPSPAHFMRKLEGVKDSSEFKHGVSSRHQSRDFAEEVRSNLFDLVSGQISGRSTPDNIGESPVLVQRGFTPAASARRLELNAEIVRKSIEIEQAKIADAPNPLMLGMIPVESDGSIIIVGDAEVVDV